MLDFHNSLLLWENDSLKVVEALRARKAVFKIVLKVKDDIFFIRRWIEHHSAIVGVENLLIMDNMSENPEMFEVYSEYGVLVVGFSGFHNRIHRVEEFSELYMALRASSKYYTFLDSDEFLSFIDENLYLTTGINIQNRLDAERATILPGSWLENVHGYEDRFWYDLKQNHPITGLKSGKPILASHANVAGMINHNRQVDKNLFDQNVVLNYFVLHMKRLSNEQRIAANIRKLIAYNAFSTQITREEIIKIDPLVFAEGNKRNWILEIQKLESTEATKFQEAPLGSGMLLVNKRMEIQFHSQGQKECFLDIISNPWRCVVRSLISI